MAQADGTNATANRLRSRQVRVDELPWENAEFTGVAYKTLLVEQTYVLEGRLVDKAGAEVGLEVGPGEFVWRPAGSRHSAWTPDGALMIATFLAPNRFTDADGREIDMFGDDWEAKRRSAMG